MVVRLAESLEVSPRERNALLLAAGYAPAYRETRFDDPELTRFGTAVDVTVSELRLEAFRLADAETASILGRQSRQPNERDRQLGSSRS